jgi:tRNA G46 methylase TrmB
MTQNREVFLVGDVWLAWLTAIGITGRGSENFLQDAFFNLVSSFDVGTAVEVGAHEATFSREIARRRPDVEVIALEANPEVHRKYLHELKSIKYLNVAAGESETMVVISVPR